MCCEQTEIIKHKHGILIVLLLRSKQYAITLNHKTHRLLSTIYCSPLKRTRIKILHYIIIFYALILLLLYCICSHSLYPDRLHVGVYLWLLWLNTPTNMQQHTNKYTIITHHTLIMCLYDIRGHEHDCRKQFSFVFIFRTTLNCHVLFIALVTL